MKVAIFARISTNDGRQDNSRQVSQLEDFCKKQNWTVAEVITEEISGAKSTSEREQLQHLFQLAGTGAIQKVIISEVSRIGRKVSDGIEIIDKLTRLGVSIYVQNIGMETLLADGRPNFMFKPILLTLIGFAEMERELLRERIKSGLKNAKRKGKTLGRPAGQTEAPEDFLGKYPKVAKELKSGLSLRKIAKLCDVSVNTVLKVREAMAA